MSDTISLTAQDDSVLSDEQVAEVVARACPSPDYSGKRVLLVIPDGTRTAPIGLMFKLLHRQIGGVVAKLDVLIALGTHQAMSEEAICGRLEITFEERAAEFANVGFFNHEWDNPDALRCIGTIGEERIAELTNGLFSMEVPVEINRRVFDYDQVMIIGPVFPHEVVGFSGGNKYFFPGIGGPQILNFFHWLGAVVTNPEIIGNKWTPVRQVVDEAGSLIKMDKRCFCLVVDPKKQLRGLYFGSPETAWDAASEQSKQVHIVYKERKFHTVLSCVPPMYDEVWTGGKGMYKLEPVVEDGGELIIYGPHISVISHTHGKLISELGYHCRDYFLKQWDRFKDHPWGILAHSTHVRGQGTFEDGVERCRIKVTLATQIPREVCESINMGYLDPNTIDPATFANREDEGVLLVPKAGEMLFRPASDLS